MNAHPHADQPAARPHPSLRDRLAGLAATLGLLAIVIGLPFVLVAIGANPLPSQVPSWDQVQIALTSPDDGTLFLRAIALVAWLAWAFMALSVLVEVVARLGGVQAPRLRGLPGLQLSQSAARSLVATAVLLFITAPAVLQTGQPGTTQAAAAEPTHSATTDTQGPLGTGGRDQTVVDRNLQAGNQGSDQAGDQGDRANRQRPAIKPHAVGAGETLWSIARTHLDDGARYPEIVELNRDLLGDDPGFLEVGWVLQVPDLDKPRGDGAVDVDLEDGERTVTVKPHDTLSEIADTELDDPNAYPQIFEASKDITQPGGAKLTDPDMIDVGWTLVIPAGASAGHNQGNDGDRSDRGGRSDWGGQGEETPPSNEQDPPVEEPTEPSAQPESDRANPGSRADASGGVDTAGETGGLDAPWLLVGLAGGGVVLAAGLYRGLKTRRRAQWRARRPGRAIAVFGPELAPVEKTINTTGASAAATVEFMDEALRRLAGQRATANLPMPALAAVELNEHNLVLHVTEPIDLEGPWEGTADGMHWRCPTDVDPESWSDLGPALEDLVAQPAPYPMLVTIGSSDDGDLWLLNCEELAAITITGDETYGRDFARYLAAELAMNPWSDGIQVDCIGIAEEIAPMERDRIHYHPTAETSGTPAGPTDLIGAVASDALADAVATIDRSTQAGVDVVTGRAAQVGADVWTARLILVDASANRAEQPVGPDVDADAETPGPADRPSRAAAGLAKLVRLTVDHTGHTGTAVVVAGTNGTEGNGRADGAAAPAARAGTVLHMTSAGRIQLADAGLDLVAVGLTSDEAHGCAALLAQSEDTTDTEIPIDETADNGWEAYATQSGSLRPQYTRPRGTASGTGAPAAAPPHTEPVTLGYPEYAVRTDAARSHDEDNATQEPDAVTLGSAARYDPEDINEDADEDAYEDADEDYAESVLAAPDEHYVAAAATTPEDLAALAPEVTARVRAEVEAADPSLDADVTDWFATNSGRPKLTLLGPVAAQAHGKALVERKAYFTELLTYLALRRRHGVTPDEVADAFNLKAAKARGYVKVVRDWLGINRATGAKHLPDATDAPAAKTRGVNVYQIDDGLLVDADLFRRLYKRGQSRGPAGIEDLRRALDLVVGRPFDQLRKGAWSWLLEGDRTDHQMQAAVADVAHLVATHGLTTGDLNLARFAVEKAMKAAPDEDTTQLNRAALAAAEGFPEEAERILRDEVCNRSDDGRAPLDLTARAEAILHNHDWLATG